MRRITFSSNVLKIIAAFCMMIDHIGYIFMPKVTLMRVIGRLAFPLFAFMIAEGCRYTRNRLRYFLCVAVFAAAMQGVYFIFTKSMYMNVFVTFSCSILLVYALHSDFSKHTRAILFVFILSAVYILNLYVKMDYGFWGCMLPVFASNYKSSGGNIFRVAGFALGLLLLSASIGGIQPYCLLSLPFLLCYNGKRGKYNLKYFFYIFYPAHLAVLYCINILINY